MRQIMASSPLVCTDAATSRCNKTLVWGTQSILKERKCKRSSNLTWRETNWCSLIGLYKFCHRCVHTVATRLLALILSLRYVAQIQSSLNSCNRWEQQNSVAATMIFTCYMRRFVAATCRGKVSQWFAASFVIQTIARGLWVVPLLPGPF